MLVEIRRGLLGSKEEEQCLQGPIWEVFLEEGMLEHFVKVHLAKGGRMGRWTER